MKLKIFWIPQVPMKSFEVAVVSVEEGVKLLDTLADYDMFQYENNIKPDYANAGGLLMYEEGEWIDWYDKEEGCDNPRLWLEEKAKKEHIEVMCLIKGE